MLRLDSKGSPPPGGSGGILIAEGDDELREALVEWLHVKGYWACGVKDGSQLLEWTEPILIGEPGLWIPDLIVADLRMPGIPAIDLLSALRQVGCDVAVLVISGKRDRHLEETARGLGCRWLSRPLERRQIQDAALSALP